MKDEALYLFLIAVFVLVGAVVVHPWRARCPPGWYVNGIRPGGSYECLVSPRGDAPNAAERPDGTPGWRLPGAIYCGSAEHPTVLDARTVGCKP